MNTDPDSLDAVRKLLALKRHEVPPPSFFVNLPEKIASRIECGEGRLNFWERVSSNFALRPAFAYAFAVAAFGAFSASVLYSGNPRNQEPQAQENGETAWSGASPTAAFASQIEFSPALHVANWLGNTNADAPPQVLPSLFSPSGHALNVSYETGN